MTVQKSHITLKYKEIDNGKKSIYLDYYKDGKRIREASTSICYQRHPRRTSSQTSGR